jgi:poly(A) polymerase
VIPRSEHTISREHISEGALKVLQTLKRHNYAGFLVGGSVRDMLLGLQPKDFDIATDATPEELTRLFRNAQIIGRRFRIVHIRFGRETIEVTTFRGHHHDDKSVVNNSNKAQRNKSGMLLRDNVYGTVEEDAIRRDFTVNALYYNIEDFAVYDYTQGMADITRRQIHIIGDPEQRYREDPVRMLRAVRLAAKLDFSIEKNTAEAIPALKHLLANAAPARLFDEVLKLFTAGYAEHTFLLLQKYELFGVLFVQTAAALVQSDYQSFLVIAMQHTDDRIHSDKRISPAYLFGTLLWPAFQQEMKTLLAQKNPPAHYQAQHIAADSVISQLVTRITLPKRFSGPMKEIWQLQFRLANRAGSRADKLFTHPRFRAAYDFVLLREEAGEDLGGLGQWWTDYQSADETVRLQMANNVSAPANTSRKRRTRKPRGPR